MGRRQLQAPACHPLLTHGPLEAALARNAGRAEGERVPEAAIANVHTMFEEPSIQEGFAVVHRLTSHA